MALLKLAVLPVIGVLWTQLLTYHSPLVNEDQKMLRFVMIFLSGGTLPNPSRPYPPAILRYLLTDSSHGNNSSRPNSSLRSPRPRNRRTQRPLCVSPPSHKMTDNRFLVSQYIVMLVSLTILVAYSLHILF